MFNLFCTVGGGGGGGLYFFNERRNRCVEQWKKGTDNKHSERLKSFSVYFPRLNYYFGISQLLGREMLQEQQCEPIGFF